MKDTENRTSAIGLCLSARAYAEAAIALILIKKKPEENAFSTGFYNMPIIFVTGHAWELVQKAYLRAEGMELENLKKIGHNLTALQRKVNESSPDLFSELLERGDLNNQADGTVDGLTGQLDLLAAWHGFELNSRYIETGSKTLGDMEFMANASIEYSRMIEPKCLEAYKI